MNVAKPAPKLRSAEWFDSGGEPGLRHQTVLTTLGFDVHQAAGKPVIGICNPASELNNCEMLLDDLVPAIKRGISEAGGVPLEFGAMPLGAELLKPSDLPYRNLVSMEIEEVLRAYPLDGVVFLCNCDKTTPAQLMAAASADLPAIQLSGGPKAAVQWNGMRVSSGTDAWRVWDDYRAGRLGPEELTRFQQCLSCSYGACNEMGTTSTMTALSEALGMMPRGTSSLPAHDSRRRVAAENAGRRIVAMVREDLRPSAILTPRAFENAIRVCMALGGSTNVILHLIAIAGRRAIRLPLALFDEISSSTPVLANLKPSGVHLVHQFNDAGGLPALMRELGGLLHTDCLTCSGRTLREELAEIRCYDSDVIRPLDRPVTSNATLVVLSGNLAPSGAILKTSAASSELFEHTGPALVFDSYQDMLARIDSPELAVTPQHVLILRNAGPRGVPGMPEWGAIPIPARLLKQGVRDMVRITDCRMSGTSFGTVILHAAPEAAAGGPLAVVRDGDAIRLDVQARRLELLVPDQQIAARMKRWSPPTSQHLRGYLRLYTEHVLQADEGCDFDFLRPESAEALKFVPPIVGRS